MRTSAVESMGQDSLIRFRISFIVVGVYSPRKADDNIFPCLYSMLARDVFYRPLIKGTCSNPSLFYTVFFTNNTTPLCHVRAEKRPKSTLPLKGIVLIDPRSCSTSKLGPETLCVEMLELIEFVSKSGIIYNKSKN